MKINEAEGDDEVASPNIHELKVVKQKVKEEK